MARKKLQNTGIAPDETVVEQAPEAVLADVMADDVTPASEPTEASEAEPSHDEAPTAQDEADLEAAGVNTAEADEDKRLRRERAALLKEVGKIGEILGASRPAMITLAERVTEAAANKAIGKDDADDIYDKFRERANAKATIDSGVVVSDAATVEKPAAMGDEGKSRAQQVSKLRTFIKLGLKFGDDAADIIRRARDIHLQLIDGGERKGVRPGSTYTVLVAVAGEQMKDHRAGQVMDNTAIHEFMSVPVVERAPADGAKKVMDALVAAEAAQRGSETRAPVESVHLDDAINSLRAALTDLNPDMLNEYDSESAEKLQKIAERADKAAEKAAKKEAKKEAAAQPQAA
jgi:molybdenum-dependent DNA-binding transcriptional regulator ModE